MNIDNSGATVVFDEKTNEAITAGKNRITLIESEVQRLLKLKLSLETDVRKLEADITYKTEIVSNLDIDITAKQTALEEATNNLFETASKATFINTELEAREANISVKESDLQITENKLIASEKSITNEIEKAANDRLVLTTEREKVSIQKEKIANLLKELCV